MSLCDTDKHQYFHNAQHSNQPTAAGRLFSPEMAQQIHTTPSTEVSWMSGENTRECAAGILAIKVAR